MYGVEPMQNSSTHITFFSFSSLKCLSKKIREKHINMRALAYFKKGDIHFTNDIPKPEIQADDEVILDVSWCGICGSDLHEYTDGPIFMPKDGECHSLSNAGLPQAMGHEMSGIIAKVGPKVTKVKVGDHVVVEAGSCCADLHCWPHSKHYNSKPCDACKKGCENLCTHAGFIGLGVISGGFAEQVVVSEHHIIPVPKEIPLDVAALVEPLSVTWHAVRLSGFQKGSSALVLGAGPIGLCTILVLKGMGAGQIVVSEVAERRMELARRLGVEIFDPRKHGEKSVESLRAMTKSHDGFDYSYDCSGIQATFDASLKALTFKGTATNIAVWGPNPVPFQPMNVTLQEKIITGSIGYVVDDFEEVVQAIHSGEISIEDCNHLITGKQKIEDGWEKGFQELMNHKESNVKILLTPNNHGEMN